MFEEIYFKRKCTSKQPFHTLDLLKQAKRPAPPPPRNGPDEGSSAWDRPRRRSMRHRAAAIMETITTCCIWISQWLQALLQWAEPQRLGFPSCCGAAAACGDIDLDLLRANHAAPDGASEMGQAMRQWHPAWI